MVDRIAPTLVCPDIYTTESNVEFQASVTDNFSKNVPITYSRKSGSSFPLGETVVSASATDQASNLATCVFTIYRDQTKPIITCPSDIITSQSNVYFQATATDNVSRNVKITYSQAPGSIFSIGETIVTATATDQASNFATCLFKIFRD